MWSDDEYSGDVVDRLILESITLGISIRDCSSRLASTAKARMYDRVRRAAGQLVDSVNATTQRFGGTVEGVFATVTPIAVVFDGFAGADYVQIAETLDRAAADSGIHGIGGFSSLCAVQMSAGDEALIRCIPDVLRATHCVCTSVSCASSLRGINVRGVEVLAAALSEGVAHAPGNHLDSRVSMLANASGSSPLMPGAFHGIEEPDASMGVAVSLTPAAVGSLASLPPEEAARALEDIKSRLLRGGDFFGRRCAEHLSKRSGLAVKPGRVELVPRESRLASEGRTSRGGLIAHPGFRISGGTSTFGRAPILRASHSVGPDVPATELTLDLLRHLSDAVAGGWELDLRLRAAPD